MIIDRKLQRIILEELRENYPNRKSVRLMECKSDDQTFNQNLYYLYEHGLIDGTATDTRSIEGRGKFVKMAKITVAGLDFLENDGGLSAILNKITVKFDDNDLQQLIFSKIDKVEAPAEKKRYLKETIQKLPSEGLKALYMRAINFGLDKAPDIFDFITTPPDKPL